MRILLFLLGYVHAQISSLELYPSTNTIQAQSTYELKFLLQQDMPINSVITFDFSTTDILVSDGDLSSCTGSVYFTTVSTNYQSCTCSSKICQIKITALVASGSLYLLKFGTLTNPSFVKPQSVSLSFNLVSTSTTQTYVVDVYSAGDLTLNSVTQSSFKVAGLNGVAISVQSQHSIEQNGQIVLTFPSEISFAKLSVNVEINSLNHTGTLSTSGQSVTVTNIFTQSIGASSSFIIYLLNVQNQESVKTSSSILIQTATSSSYLIDSVGFSITTTTPENIVVSYVNTLDTSIVNKLATYQFTLQPVLKFTSGGYLEIQFPSQLSIQTNMTCQRIIGLTLVSGTTYGCTYSGQKVRTTNLQYPNVANSMILTVSNIINPSSTKPTSTFYFKTYDSDGNLMCVSSTSSTFTANSATLSATVTRAATTVALQSQYTISITNTNSIPLNGYITINLGTQALKQSSQTLQCTDNSNNAIGCSYINDTAIQIMTTQIIHANSVNTIILQYLNNPNYVITSASDLCISTSDTYLYTIDQLNSISVTPTLTPINMISIAYYRDNQIFSTSTLNIGTTTQVELQFQVSSQYIVNNDGNAVIDLGGHYYLNPTETISCTQIVGTSNYSKNCIILSYISQNAPVMYLISQVKIPNIIINGNSSIDIIISGLRSELISGTVTHSIYVYIYTLANQLVSSGQNTVGNTQIINSIVSLTQLDINSDTQITSKLSQYTITHILQYPIDIQSRNGYLKLSLPSEVGSDSISSCLVTIGSNTLTCSATTSTVTITSTFDPYQIGQTLTIILSQVRNPYSTATTSQFKLQYYYSNTLFAESDSTYSITQPNSLNVNVQRTPTLINENAQLVFTLQLDNEVSTLDYKLIIQNDQITITQLQILQNNLPIAVSVDNTKNNQITLKFKESMCPCSIGTKLTFILSGFNNPIISSNSVAQLILIDDSNNIYQQNQTVIVPGVSLGSITITSLSQTASQLNQTTIIKISISIDTPMDNAELLLVFDPHYLPFSSDSNIIINLNQIQIACTIDQSKYSIACQSISLKDTNIITIQGIKTIKWLTINPACSITIQTYYNTYLLDSVSGYDCTSLMNLPIKTFDSSIVRSNRVINQNTDVTITFDQEISTYVTIKLPLTEAIIDPQLTYPGTATVSVDPQYIIMAFQLTSTNEIIIQNLQNANSIASQQSQYIIELSNDGQTVSYSSKGIMNPDLICQGSQCSSQQLTLLSYQKSTTVISSRSDIVMSIQLPQTLQYVVSLTFTASETSIDSTTQCYLNNTLTSCTQIIKSQCTLCDQTQVILTIKNAINSDQYSPLEKICVSLETSTEITSTCSSFSLSYNYLLDLTNIQWTQNSYFNPNAQLQFNFKLTSPLNNKFVNTLQFTNTNNQIDFTNSAATINNNDQKLEYSNQIVKITICSSGCTNTQTYSLIITNISILKNYIYSQDQVIQLSIFQQSQQLEQSQLLSIYPSSLLINDLTVTAIAEDYVQLNYTITSSVAYESESIIKFTFQNSNCVQQQTLGTYTLMSMCSLKDNKIIKVQLIYNNQITHQSSEQITLTVVNSVCPSAYVNYNDNCLNQCPSTTYNNNQICQNCSQSNCSNCPADSCNQCVTNYVLNDGQCEPLCLIAYCDSCNSEIQQCNTCLSPYQLYKNQCLLENDCQLDYCQVCKIENQNISCVTCNTDAVRYQSSCLSKCPTKFYSDEDQNCQNCSTGCLECNSLVDCIKCDSQYYLINNLCQCQIDGCEQCSSSKCDSCQSIKPILFNNQCLSQCPTGYYVGNNTCNQCDTSCSTCDETGCLTCTTEQFLQNNECIQLDCIINCNKCENNDTCQQCDKGYQLSLEQKCEKIEQYPYFGAASTVYIAFAIGLLIYQIVSIIIPPKLLILPQIILSTIVIFSSLSTLGNFLLLLYSFITEEAIIFTLSTIMFSINNIYYFQTSLTLNNPLLTFITLGTIIRTPLLKMKYLSQPHPQQLTNYQLIRQVNKYDNLITTIISLVLGIIIVSIQSPNELPSLGVMKVSVDFLLLVNFALEKRLF